MGNDSGHKKGIRDLNQEPHAARIAIQSANAVGSSSWAFLNRPWQPFIHLISGSAQLELKPLCHGDHSLRGNAIGPSVELLVPPLKRIPEDNYRCTCQMLSLALEKNDVFINVVTFPSTCLREDEDVPAAVAI